MMINNAAEKGTFLLNHDTDTCICSGCSFLLIIQFHIFVFIEKMHPSFLIHLDGFTSDVHIHGYMLRLQRDSLGYPGSGLVLDCIAVFLTMDMVHVILFIQT